MDKYTISLRIDMDLRTHIGASVTVNAPQDNPKNGS